MAAAGLVEVTDISHEGNRPLKTVYGITEAGRAELLRLLSDAWAKPAGMAQPVDVALFFIWFLPPAEVAARLGDRIGVLDGALAQIAANRSLAFEMMKASGSDAPVQYVEMMTELFDHARQIVQTERDWSEHTRRRVHEGVFDFAPSITKEDTQ
jgi:DNA-binding PadR family transcriptional regulator